MIFATAFNPSYIAILVVIVILLGFSGILALAETSLVRTSKARARSLYELKKRGSKSLYKLAENPERFLSPILLLVLICQLVSATLLGIIAENLFGAWGVALATAAEIIFVFVLAEAIPKHWAVRHPDKAALFASPIITAIINFPPIKVLSAVLIGLANALTKEIDDAEAEPDVTESELLALADVALEEEVIEEQERELISSIIEFGDTIVREVMVPRPDIVAAEKNQTVGEVLEIAMEGGLSRIPVYDTAIDNITGIAYTKDLIKLLREDRDGLKIEEFARNPKYVPETKKVAALLKEMQTTQTHLAVVIDEYGVTSGIVTLEDLIEELVGDIADEFDTDEPAVEPLGNGGFRVPGKMAVDEVNELLQTTLPATDADTIAGLFLHMRGQIPKEGESITIEDYRLTAEKVQRRRISKIRISGPEKNPKELTYSGDRQYSQDNSDDKEKRYTGNVDTYILNEISAYSSYGSGPKALPTRERSNQGERRSQSTTEKPKQTL